MATDTAHISLELASGRNEITAPFHHTAQRRRPRIEDLPIKEEDNELPVSTPVVVDVPLGTDVVPNIPPPVATEVVERPSVARPTWIAFIGATLAVAAGMWLVMSQRMPDIDPRDVIQRNLVDARSAMAEGRYTDPPERSAFHYYNTVLSLDPANADAMAGIDAIADRHLTNARVMLSEKRVAEAAVALDRARRVRPQHEGLPALDTQLRTELKKILLAANASLQVAPAKPKVAKPPAVATPRADTPSVPVSQPLLTQKQTVAPIATPAPASPPVTRVAQAPALLSLTPESTEQTSPSLITPVPDESGSAPVVDEPVNAPAATAALPESAPAPVPSVAPKLIRMVQPEYPQEALMRGIEGWVDVSLQVTAAGDVDAPRVEGTSRGRIFNRAALNAIQQWKYQPREGGAGERIVVRLQFRYSNK